MLYTAYTYTHLMSNVIAPARCMRSLLSIYTVGTDRRLPRHRRIRAYRTGYAGVLWGRRWAGGWTEV